MLKTGEIVHHFWGHLSISDNLKLTLTLKPAPNPSTKATCKMWTCILVEGVKRVPKFVDHKCGRVG